ncbi:Protein DP71L [Mizuhopecten yessoensis]|uniref:Protein DP71L n=2 Tax=Mizuhopecten yessoensis TaxID=6573 RepID=A0A210Q4Q8_MIZYE|nr:Protein DP71L [Mizuhopecten yessoensis]
MATNSPKEPSPTNGCESDKRQQEILDVNLKWSMNFSISQREKSKSKVTFAEGDQLCTVYDLDDEDRKSHWEECVRDRERFQRRITEVGEIMKPVLSMERRDRIYHQYLKQN